MRATVIPVDRWVRRDDQAANLSDWPFNDSEIHAIQWYSDSGEIEFVGTPKPPNQPFTDASILEPYLEALQAHLDALAAEQPV